MKIDVENFERLAKANKLFRGTWGDGRETACLMSAIASPSLEGCVAQGWPQWLVEVGTWVFDTSEYKDKIADSFEFIEAAKAFDARGGDPDRLFRDFRLQSVLPEAMAAIGPGDEPWRVKCRDLVQWCLDNDGQAADAEYAAWAARAARAADAAWAAGAADAADAAGAACRRRMLGVLYRLMRGDAVELKG